MTASGKRTIIVSANDHRRLEELLASNFTSAISDKPYLQVLRGELSAARIVDAADVPPDVVTMNSVVQLCDLSTHEMETYTLVYPAEANIVEGKLSVLAPIGTAILGHRVGDLVRWQVPNGAIRMRIAKIVSQPIPKDLATSA